MQDQSGWWKTQSTNCGDGENHIVEDKHGEKSRQAWRSFTTGAESVRVVRDEEWDQKCWIDASQKNRHERIWKDVKKRISILEELKVLAKNSREWKIEGQKRKVTRKDTKDCGRNSRLEAFMAQKGLWNVAKNRMLEDRGVLPK